MNINPSFAFMVRCSFKEVKGLLGKRECIRLLMDDNGVEETHLSVNEVINEVIC